MGTDTEIQLLRDKHSKKEINFLLTILKKKLIYCFMALTKSATFSKCS